MKTTLLDKWNYYNNLIKEKERAFVESEVKLIPEFLYYVNPNGTIGKKTTTKATYYNGKHFSFNKKPTKIDVEDIKAFYNSNYDLLRSCIHIHYEEVSSTGKSSSAVKLTELNKFLSEEEANLKSIEILEKNANEEILLQNGHTRCQRCKKVFPATEAVKSNIIGRSRKPIWNEWKRIYEDKAYVTQTIMEFCSAECASNEQMSREG